jgi:glucokinase
VKPYGIGIDVGGTKIAAGVLDREMNMLSVCLAKEHAGKLPAQVVDAIEKSYQAAIEQAGIDPDQVAGVGLSFAGHTHGSLGVVLTSSNMPEWDRMPLRDVVAKRLRQHVLLDNDANVGSLLLDPCMESLRQNIHPLPLGHGPHHERMTSSAGPFIRCIESDARGAHD